MWKDFKEFALKGNVIDLAVAVVIGAAFGKIVSSLVENIIMPLIGLITGGYDFSGLSIKSWIQKLRTAYSFKTVVDFLIVAFAIFLAVRLLSKFKKKEVAIEEAVPEVDAKEELLKEIRDLLKRRKGSYKYTC